MSNNDDGPTRGSFRQRRLGRLKRWLRSEPEDKEQLTELLKSAKRQAIMDSDALSMMEGVLQVSELRVRDIMIPRAQMVVVERDALLGEMIPGIIESAHSRFPVIGDDRGEVVGILLAKDLLGYCFTQEDRSFNLRDSVRSAVFVPESKRLNVLLKEFRASRNHMAIVVDEYGSAAGLVTIEDVLEQIVGEIEDEHDIDAGTVILKRGESEYTTKAHTTIEDFNDYFASELQNQDFDTIGGLVIHALGHLPKRGESVIIDRFCFEVLHADSRRIHLLKIELLAGASGNAE